MKELYRSRFDRELEIENATVFIREEPSSEQSSITFHKLLPGIELAYSFFRGHMDADAETHPHSRGILEINHCRQGRYGCLIQKNRAVYLGSGEIGANILGIERTRPEFPLGFYEGLTLLIDVSTAAESLRLMFPSIAEQLALLKRRLEENDGVMLIRGVPELNHIFEELYHVNPQIEQPYMALKALEIILTMQLAPYDRAECKPEYFKRSEIEKIKELHREATQHLNRQIPFRELAEKYRISLTGAKTCFKKVYGEPYFSYMRKYRMHQALHYLEESRYSIAEIAGLVGYDNPSKFSAAFCSVIGCTPKTYRKNSGHLEHFQLAGVEINEETSKMVNSSSE